MQTAQQNFPEFKAAFATTAASNSFAVFASVVIMAPAGSPNGWARTGYNSGQVLCCFLPEK